MKKSCLVYCFDLTESGVFARIVVMARVYRLRSFSLILLAISICAQRAAGDPRQALSRIPVGFEPNIGQANEATRYLARGSGFWLLLGSSDVSLALQAKKETLTLKVEWIGGNRQPVTQGKDLLPGTSNYFLGGEPKDWYTNIPNYGRIEYQDVYPGIDFIFYGNQRQLEYDMVLKPDARLDSVKLRYTGATRIAVDSSGDLVLYTPTGEFHQRKPLVYQNVAGMKRALRARYVLKKDVVGLKVDHYDQTQPLVIDPVLSYSSYFGGPDNELVTGMTMDSSGSVYLTGTADTGFPTAPGAFQAHPVTQCPCGFVVKFSPQLNSVIYSTFVWGTNPKGIAVDTSGNAYIAGGAGSSLATRGAFQTMAGGQNDAFVAKLNAAGSALTYLTYLGGSGNDVAMGIAVDASGNAYVVGTTMSPNFPVTPGAIQPQYAGAGDAFISKLSSDGTSLIYSTYFGDIGSDLGAAIAADSLGFAYVTGGIQYCPNACGQEYDAFVIELDPLGNGIYGVPIYGSAYTAGTAIAVDSTGNAYVGGVTSSTDLIVTPNAFQTQLNGGQDGFVAEVDAAGNVPYVSYFGASGTIMTDPFGGTARALTNLQAIAVDANRNVSILGSTDGMIALKNPIQSINGEQNVFVAKLSLTGSGSSALLFSSYLGGTGTFGENPAGIALDPSGNLVIAGNTYSTDFPVTPGVLQSSNAGQSDAFIARILSSEPCGYGATPSSPMIAGSGGTATINVVAGAGCAWRATNNDPSFLTITSARSGSGSATVTVSAAPSSLAKSRTGTVVVAGQVISVIQQPGITCTYSLSATSQTFTIAGGSGSITVTANQQCYWSDSTSASWVHLGILGTQGTQALTFTVDANMGPPRTAAITIAGQTFTVNQAGAPSIVLSRSTLNFGLLGSLVTGPQTIDLSFYGLPNESWTAQASGGFTVTPLSGTGNATLRVTINPAGTGSGALFVYAPGAVNSPARVNVNLQLGASGPPFGSFDAPTSGTTGIAGAIPVTGWALDNIEVTSVGIWREPAPGEATQSNGLVFIGNAVFVAGARPDVQAAYPNAPFNYSAGWGYMLLTNFLPNASGLGASGNGTYKLHAIITNASGQTLDLGARAITVDNVHASKPFGTIDTPAQGGTASGNSYVNFGWALTQNPHAISIDGSTITVILDGVPVGHPTYNQYRSDIANLFPGLANSNNAVGFFFIDPTTIANGVHTISWNVFDNAGRGDGIGSRYFTVANTGAANVPALNEPIDSAANGMVTLRRDFDFNREPAQLAPDETGVYSVSMQELDRIELQVGAANGYLLMKDERLPLPVGSTLKGGRFYWHAGPGFVGEYNLLFERADTTLVRVRVKVEPRMNAARESR